MNRTGAVEKCISIFRNLFYNCIGNVPQREYDVGLLLCVVLFSFFFQEEKASLCGSKNEYVVVMFERGSLCIPKYANSE